MRKTVRTRPGFIDLDSFRKVVREEIAGYTAYMLLEIERLKQKPPPAWAPPPSPVQASTRSDSKPKKLVCPLPKQGEWKWESYTTHLHMARSGDWRISVISIDDGDWEWAVQEKFPDVEAWRAISSGVRYGITESDAKQIAEEQAPVVWRHTIHDRKVAEKEKA